MAPDPARDADAKAWMTKAAGDLSAAAHQLTATPPFTADAVFHAQQAAEKAMKGLLAWHDVPFRASPNRRSSSGHTVLRVATTLDRAIGARR